MSTVAEQPPVMPPDAPARDTLSAYASRWWTGVKGGELGSLPIILGLIIICLVFFCAAFAFCFWQNDRILNIMDRPLQKATFHKNSQDPLEQSAAYQQSLKQLSLQLAVVSREMARSDDVNPALQAQFASLSQQAARTAAAAPKATGRRPVTLGVGEPFDHLQDLLFLFV